MLVRLVNLLVMKKSMNLRTKDPFGCCTDTSISGHEEVFFNILVSQKEDENKGLFYLAKSRVSDVFYGF